MRISCSFLSVFYDYHQSVKAGKPSVAGSDFVDIENIWMGFYGLGRFETYRFLYEECTSLEDLEEWLIRLKGEGEVRASAEAFDKWTKRSAIESDIGFERSILTEEQMKFWQDQGYIRVSKLVDDKLCDAVSGFICGRLAVDLSRPETWYNDHPEWHGLMLQVYQHESIYEIKQLPLVLQLFAELYGTSAIIANTEKVSFNPPESPAWRFRHNKLHWDIDFRDPDLQYIQGLVYLNDVPEDRGPLTVVPGFHHRFEEWMKTYPDPDEAREVMQATFTGVPVPGEKGDIILWRQTLPHAASANHSDQPRFVQYVSFSNFRVRTR